MKKKLWKDGRDFSHVEARKGRAGGIEMPHLAQIVFRHCAELVANRNDISWICRNVRCLIM